MITEENNENNFEEELNEKLEELQNEANEEDDVAEEVEENMDAVKDDKKKKKKSGFFSKKENKELENLKGANEKVTAQLQEVNDKYLRLVAEFDNMKRRTAKERIDLIGSASEDVIKNLLPVIDDFDRAFGSAEKAEDIAAVVDGFKLIKNKLDGILKAKGLECMESMGETFDAEVHEALTEIPAPDKDATGKVLDVIEKGYKLNDKIIRYAKVVVGK